MVSFFLNEPIPCEEEFHDLCQPHIGKHHDPEVSERFLCCPLCSLNVILSPSDHFVHPPMHHVQAVVCKVFFFLLLWQEFEDLSSLYHCVLFFLHGGRFELVLQPKYELSTGFFLMLN